jgi:Transposase DDE domain
MWEGLYAALKHGRIDPPAYAANTGGFPPCSSVGQSLDRHGTRCHPDSPPLFPNGGLQGSKPETLSHPDLHWQSADERIVVDGWMRLHLKAAREVEGTLIRVTHLDPTRDDTKELWLFWRSPFDPPLGQMANLYRLRFSIEHGIRFAKQALHWTDLRVRTVDQFERWADRHRIVPGLECYARDAGWNH